MRERGEGGTKIKPKGKAKGYRETLILLSNIQAPGPNPILPPNSLFPFLLRF